MLQTTGSPTAFARATWRSRRISHSPAASKTRPTPATLKSFTNWINKGANVYRVTNTQIKKWCNPTRTCNTNASVKNALCGRFGKSTIKAVCSAKSGGYIVATAPTWKGKSFKFPS